MGCTGVDREGCGQGGGFAQGEAVIPTSNVSCTPFPACLLPKSLSEQRGFYDNQCWLIEVDSLLCSKPTLADRRQIPSDGQLPI